MNSKTLNLIVVSENFGISYSGGSSATAYFLEEMVSEFDSITVLCQNHDDFLNSQINIIEYTDIEDVPRILNNYSPKNTVLYGDFHICHVIADLDFPFYFTYHDNWPEIGNFEKDEEMSKDIMSKYRKIFQSAEMVFSVSKYKIPFISEFTDNVILVRNGLTQPRSKQTLQPYEAGVFRILMIGNITSRKYDKAIELFSELAKLKLDLQIDIYGNVVDEVLFKQLTRFDFVHFKKFKKEINHSGYHLLLQTSLVENLSLSVVDAINNNTPVVSFGVGGIHEIINENNGRIIKSFDIVSMAFLIKDMHKGFPRFQFDEEHLSTFDWAKGAKLMMRAMQLRNDTISTESIKMKQTV